MPVGSYGFGNLFFAGRGRFKTRRADASRYHYDGLECFNLFLPVIPLSPVHVWDWRQVSNDWSWTKRVVVYEYQAIPIRWTWDLLVRVLYRFWLWQPLIAGLLLSMSAAHAWPARFAAFLLFAASLGGLIWLAVLEHRDRRIRRLLGLHRFGYSDPVYWTDQLQELLAAPSAWFDQPSFAQAAENMIAIGRWSDAMWAARLCTAVENSAAGEELTDRILAAAGAPATDLRRDEFPKLRASDTEAGQYWRGMAFGRSRARFTETVFAGHLGGSIAAALEDDDATDDEIAELEPEALREPKRSAAEEAPFRLAGVALVVGVLVCCVGLVWFSGFFRRKSAAQLAVEQTQREWAERRQAKEQKRKQEQGQAEIPQSLGEPGSWRQVAELPLIEGKPGPWPIATNGTTGEQIRRQEIVVAGVPSPKGIGMHPPNEGYASAKVRLDGKASRFAAAAALNDSAVDTRDVAIFEVWGDGRRLWQSRPLRRAAESDDCDIDVRNVDLLELRVVAVGDYWGLHAVWVEPRVLVAR